MMEEPKPRVKRIVAIGDRSSIEYFDVQRRHFAMFVCFVIGLAAGVWVSSMLWSTVCDVRTF